MKKTLLLSLLLTAGAASANADKLVGGDLSLVPAYEAAGDQWLDAKGQPTGDLITYVKEKCGWNAVRVRLFVDPSKDAYKSTCQDLDYVKKLGKRIKDAGMTFLLDLHYSDTWADPGNQRIPAAWTDHSTAGLCQSVYTYTHETVQALIEAGAKPDYVQIGNEITYGLLWDTPDGKYPTNANEYTAAGYCTTWNSTYATNSAWPRTAAILDNAAQGVHKAFHASGQDSTSVKIVLHTELSGMTANSDNFYKHLRTAGMTNYDVIGLSYYPTEHGDLLSLSSVLTTLKSDFPDKEVQIVETGYYNEGQHTTKYDFSQTWPYTAVGQYSFLSDLTNRLKKHDNVTGLYYWMPEECGPGHSQTVWDYTFNRGFWKCSSASTHSLITTPTGVSPISVLSSFLSEGTEEGDFKTSDYFQNLDFETGDLTGWTQGQSWTTMWPNNISSWASADVVQGTYTLELWNASAEEGNIISTGATVPNGRYTITCRAHANQEGFFLWANKKKTLIKAGENGTWSVTTDAKDVLEFGLGTVASSTERYCYADDFTVTYVGEAIGDDEEDIIEGDDNQNYTDAQGLEYALWPESHTAGLISGHKAVGTEEEGVINIPNVITINEEDYHVTYIDANAFANNTALVKVTIPNSVYEILGSAFSGCYNLKDVTFAEGSNLGSIASWAFHNTALDSISIPAGVKQIPEGCFASCWALKKVELLAEDLSSIGKFAFSAWAEEGSARSWSTFDEGFMIYAIEPPVIDADAFNAEDIAGATLFVFPGLEANEVYTSLGFAEVKPLDGANPENNRKAIIDGVKYSYWLADDEGNEEGTHAGISGYTSTMPAALVIPDAIHPNGVEEEMPVTFINAWGMQNAPLTSLQTASGISHIFEGTFAGCAALTDVVLTGNIQSIGDFAFSNWAEEGCRSKGAENTAAYKPFRNVVIYCDGEPEISEKAFCKDDVAEATLYVDDWLTDNEVFNSLGFKAVKSIQEFTDGIGNTIAKTTPTMLYDLCGRVLQSRPVKGFYIANGKKVIQ
ncbi:MAG: glycosyl hydrolase 53 family protein [Bacteroidales bacterium]|nr:glycosyl hydrolase 53 family protein [Bacteroidales bacterium]